MNVSFLPLASPLCGAWAKSLNVPPGAINSSLSSSPFDLCEGLGCIDALCSEGRSIQPARGTMDRMKPVSYDERPDTDHMNGALAVQQYYPPPPPGNRRELLQTTDGRFQLLVRQPQLGYRHPTTCTSGYAEWVKRHLVEIGLCRILKSDCSVDCSSVCAFRRGQSDPSSGYNVRLYNLVGARLTTACSKASNASEVPAAQLDGYLRRVAVARRR